ncbi:MAG: hypothetical protein AAF730_14130 [Bacteroidota bacterium]
MRGWQGRKRYEVTVCIAELESVAWWTEQDVNFALVHANGDRWCGWVKAAAVLKFEIEQFMRHQGTPVALPRVPRRFRELALPVRGRGAPMRLVEPSRAEPPEHVDTPQRGRALREDAVRWHQDDGQLVMEVVLDDGRRVRMPVGQPVLAADVRAQKPSKLPFLTISGDGYGR